MLASTANQTSAFPETTKHNGSDWSSRAKCQIGLTRHARASGKDRSRSEDFADSSKWPYSHSAACKIHYWHVACARRKLAISRPLGASKILEVASGRSVLLIANHSWSRERLTTPVSKYRRRHIPRVLNALATLRRSHPVILPRCLRRSRCE